MKQRFLVTVECEQDQGEYTFDPSEIARDIYEANSHSVITLSVNVKELELHER